MTNDEKIEQGINDEKPTRENGFVGEERVYDGEVYMCTRVSPNSLWRRKYRPELHRHIINQQERHHVN